MYANRYFPPFILFSNGVYKLAVNSPSSKLKSPLQFCQPLILSLQLNIMHTFMWKRGLKFITQINKKCFCRLAGTWKCALRVIWDHVVKDTTLLAWKGHLRRLSSYGKSHERYFCTLWRLYESGPSCKGAKYCATLLVGITSPGPARTLADHFHRLFFMEQVLLTHLSLQNFLRFVQPLSWSTHFTWKISLVCPTSLAYNATSSKPQKSNVTVP